ncbi:MAG: glycosyltransferase [Acidobacteria bacterium]|nr:glycosyltransferase [Acidobacteriota bacterium]
MRVAITHDWLNGMRGGEKVLEALLELYPEATIFTLFHERGKVSPLIESHQIVASWLDRIPGIYKHYRNLLPLFPSATQSWKVSGFDLVISSSHAVAKGVNAPNALHVCYCHTPMRYVWDAGDDYAMTAAQRMALKLVRSRMQRWDCQAAGRVDFFIANSKFVRERINEYYVRDAEVIHPPIDTRFYTPSIDASRKEFYLSVGALVPYKRFDIVVDAFNTLGKPLIIAGHGPELRRLRNMAKSNVDVRGWVTDEQLRDLYRRARALVFAGREDFGMVSVEAQACGCPVIAFSAGGSSEIVQDGVNGILFTEQHADDLIRAVRRFETMSWSVETVCHRVESFSRESFKAKFARFIEERTKEKRNSAVAAQFA